MRAVVSAGAVATTTPTVESEEFDGEVFFDGFAAGLDAEDHAFAISFGTLDMMANLMLKRPVTARELQ